MATRLALRRNRIATASALAALFAATACGGAPSQTARTTTTSSTGSTTTSSTGSTTTSTVPGGQHCTTNAAGQMVCSIPGRPLWRGRRRRGPLLPEGDPAAPGDAEARAEYASVAAFGELALRLMALGAPAALVEACHRAALDEIRHAEVMARLSGRAPRQFGPVRGLMGRRIGRILRSRRAQIRSLAVESFLDGWLNEGSAATDLRARAQQAVSDDERDLLLGVAEDEQRHADLGREIVEWCFEEEPVAVGRALASVSA